MGSASKAAFGGIPMLLGLAESCLHLFVRVARSLLELLQSLLLRNGLEDQFHASKAGAGTRTLTARFRPSSPQELERLLVNLSSPRTDGTLEAIAIASPRFKGIETVADVLCGKHAALVVRTNYKRCIVEIDIDHRFVGGSMFYRFVEALVDSDPRLLPPSQVLQGLLCAITTLPTLVSTARLPMRPIPSGPHFHAVKRYELPREAGCSRRTAAYFHLLQDALAALGGDQIHVAFSVVFSGQPKVVNNVGLVVVRFDHLSTPATLASAIDSAKAYALATNALTVTGVGRFFGNGMSVRQRLDVICSSMVVESGSLDAELTVHPTTQVYERAYVSLYSRLLGGGVTSVVAAVTTNDAEGAAGWLAAGFKPPADVPPLDAS